MKTHLLSILFLPCFLSAQTWDDAIRFDSDVASQLTNTAVAVSPDGSTFITGALRGGATFDTIHVAGEDPATTYGFLLKMNPAFRAEWVRLFPEKAYDVTTDATGNAFVGGSRSGDTLSWAGKFNATGELLASFVSTGGNSHVRVVRTDSNGNCYIGGWMNAQAAFGGITPPVVGGREAFIASLSPDLSQTHWATLTGASNRLDELYDLEVSNDGYVYASGNYRQTFNIFTLSYNGDFFVEKHQASSGASVLQKIFSGGSGTTTRQFVALSPDGQTLYTGGSFKKTMQLAPGQSLTAESGTDDYHIFLAALNTADFALNWATKVALIGDNYPQGMVRLENELVMHGYIVSTSLMGANLLTPTGGSDPFVVRSTLADGSVNAAELFPGAGVERGYGLDTRNGGLAVSGNLSTQPLAIGEIELSGTNSGLYVARVGGSIPLDLQFAGVQNPTCNGASDGTAQAVPQGGSGPYAFLWNTGDTTAVATGLTAGDYSVTITDAGGEQVSLGLVLTDPPALVVSAISENISCSGAVDGAILSSATGGEGDYLFQWSNDAETPDIQTLGPGDYTLTVTDANGCTATWTAAITEPEPLELATVTLENAACGQANGQAAVSASGGNEPYLFKWSNQATGASVTGLSAGNYTVSVTDANGCTADLQLTIQDAGNTLAAAVDILHAPACDNTADGQLAATVTGGTAPYTYHWSNEQTGAAISGLQAGSYAVTVTDGAGCSAIENIELESQTMLLVSMNITAQNDCSGDSLAAVTAGPMNGMPPYTYQWDTGDTTANLSGLPAGNYFVTITDAAGCTAVAGATFTDPPPLNSEITAMETGLTVAQSGAQYQWFDCMTGEPAAGATSQHYQPEENGEYAVEITLQGCTVTSDCVPFDLVAADEPGDAPGLPVVYPNPNNGRFTLYLPGESAIRIFDAAGKIVKQYRFSAGYHQVDLGPCPAGVYMLIAGDSHTMSIIEMIKLN